MTLVGLTGLTGGCGLLLAPRPRAFPLPTPSLFPPTHARKTYMASSALPPLLEPPQARQHAELVSMMRQMPGLYDQLKVSARVSMLRLPIVRILVTRSIADKVFCDTRPREIAHRKRRQQGMRLHHQLARSARVRVHLVPMSRSRSSRMCESLARRLCARRACARSCVRLEAGSRADA